MADTIIDANATGAASGASPASGAALAGDLDAAAAALTEAEQVIAAAITRLTELGGPDQQQVFAYELAHAGAGITTARGLLDYGAKGEVEARLTCGFAADAIHDLSTKLIGRETLWGVGSASIASDFVARYRDPEFLASLATTPGPRHLNDDMEMVQDTFRAFAADVVAPHAEHVHRTNGDVPEQIVSGLAEIGAFGLSVPADYGGFSEGGDDEYTAMVVATEELSRASLGIGGSLITRPEILTRALVKGGTEEQKLEWLPKLAAAEVMPAVAVTEPDYGSDVAGIKVTATPATGPDGADGYVINGVKTWCTFGARAEALALLARTDPDRSKGHRGLSLFIVPKPRGEAHGFQFSQDPVTVDGAERVGKMEGRPIDTIGYRGMHSYEIALEDWWVPAENLVGGDDGLGKGFYLQMAGFENGRLQTAARAVGVMQAAYEAAVEYAENRNVFGSNIIEYQLTQAKLGRMAMIIQASRQFAYAVGQMMARDEGAMEASMIKAYVCKAAEWVAREALQIHGGFGYAEEYEVSRLFVDARVLSIFEGADETLCLKVIARRLTA
ncbi:MAG: acyl-CoA dehydrogenase family protein [Ilumatobacter sp.]|uniref:acyl-CoA dehydrogenase family protein n=1 Tax=Ilumatobacter sp. TaxID=1967498 RepID=UPI0026187BE1|nr:acyl-CoA dehydrogenase family protein [Ilumatobacter sp.]MDJ0769136.1 acyl-CoA dehydrogenase family protein [Ilumatobacter sp.]